MQQIQKSDYQLAVVRIHLAGVAFYRAAYERNKTLDNKEKLLAVMQDALQQIEEIVNGKSTS